MKSGAPLTICYHTTTEREQLEWLSHPSARLRPTALQLLTEHYDRHITFDADENLIRRPPVSLKPGPQSLWTVRNNRSLQDPPLARRMTRLREEMGSDKRAVSVICTEYNHDVD